MIIHSATFISSFTELKKMHAPTLPEFAFIGRSNVGKSTLINALCNNNKLAKTSSTPGKTQTINHFLINEAWYLVDLPGYGYAKVSKTQRAFFQEFISKYLTKRDSLVTLFVLIDSRLKPQKIDLEFINWLGDKSLPFSIVLTKTDKISSRELKDNIAAFQDELFRTWEELPAFFITSAKKKLGREEILDYIELYAK
jgi:GTP-binding protein